MTGYPVPRRSTLFCAALGAALILASTVSAADSLRLHRSDSPSKVTGTDTLRTAADNGVLLAQTPQKTPDRAKQIKELLNEAVDLAKERKFDPALNKVQQARSLDSKDERIPKTESKIKEMQKEAEAEAREQRLDSLLDQAEEAIDNQQFNTAKTALDNAAQVEADNKRLAKLRKELAEEQEKANREKVADQVEKALDQADKLLDEEKFDEALTAVNSALQLDRTNKKALKLRDKISKEKAEYQAESVERQVDAYLDRAKEAEDNRNYDQALAAVDEALKLNSEDRKAQKLKQSLQEDKARWEERQKEERVKDLLERADDLLDQGQFDQARQEVQKALDTDAQNDDALKLRVEIAEAETEARARQVEDQVEALVDQAENQLKVQDFEAAKQSVNQALQLDNANKKANKLLQKISEEEQEAQAKARENYLESQMDKADALVDQDQYDGALAVYDQLLKQYPQNEDVREARADALEEKQDFLEDQAREQAKAQARQAEDLARQSQQAFREEQYDRSLQLAREALAKDPENSRAREFLAKAQEKKAAEAQVAMTPSQTAEPAPTPEVPTAQEAKAAEAARKEMAKKRDTLLKQGDDALKDRRYDEAITQYTQAVKLDPDSAEARAKLDQAQAEKNAAQTRQASEQDFDRLIRESNELLAAGNIPEARARARQALELNVNNDRAQDLLERIQEAEGGQVSQQARTKVEEGRRLMDAEQFAAARAAFEEALQILPGYEPATRALNELDQRQQSYRRQQVRDLRAQTERQARELLNDGKTLYNQGKLEEARNKWLEAKEILNTYNTEHPESPVQIAEVDIYLQNTEQEYNQLLAERARRTAFREQEQDARAKMMTPVTIKTERTTPLVSFLSTLRLATGIDFVIAEGVDAKVDASFTDKPLHEVLDAVLIPLGLKWERDPGSDIIKITPNLVTRIFPLTPDEASNVSALLENRTLQQLLYGPDGTPKVERQNLYLDERNLVLVITDSQRNIDKVASLLETLKQQAPPGLIWRSWSIKEEKGPQIKGMLDALLRLDAPEPFQPERKLILEGSLLIIKDTPENIKRAEEILQDQDFLQKIYTETLAVETFNLTPVTALDANPDLVREFADFVVEVVETRLYAKEGRQKARAEGRRLWFDPATMQLTITDYPENLTAVADFIESLPQIKKEKRSKIIFLKHGAASDIRGQIEEFLGISTAPTGGTDTGLEVTKSLRTGQGSGAEFTWREMTVRVTRVNENDINDDSDDDAELIIRTPGNSQTLTIEKYRTEFVDDYEITAEDIKPSSTPGEGRVKLRLAYRPTGAGGGGGGEFFPGIGTSGQSLQGGTPGGPVGVTPTPSIEEVGVNIVDIENLNALFVEYRDIGDLKEIEYWVGTLDQPTLQVSLEVKFVEVIEDRAKELSSEFSIEDLTDISDVSEGALGTRFGRDIDEFRSVFEPPIETDRSTNLNKGTTALNWDGGASGINFQLRYLESSGIINVINGPHVTVLNREAADFQIERQFGIPIPLQGATTGGAGANAQFQAVPSLNAVDMSLEPTITSLGDITLEVDAEINDFDQNLGVPALLQPPTGDLISGQPGTRIASANTNFNLGVLRKVLTTNVRIKDGGTVVLGGWTSQRDQNMDSGVPLLRDLPFVGKLLFSRKLDTSNKITLLIFLSGNIVD
jgi:type II secretory pathway component GspD/PulD (secretin)